MYNIADDVEIEMIAIDVLEALFIDCLKKMMNCFC